MYPNIASKIEIRVKATDPERDYCFKPEFADATIAVTLCWRDKRAVCDYLSCTETYPGERIRTSDDVPKVFPEDRQR